MRIAMDVRGLSIAATSQRLGVAPRTLQHYLGDAREPGFERLVEFSEITGVPIGDLLRRSDDRPFVVPAIAGETLTQVPVVDATLSGGDAVANATAEIVGHIGFPESWLVAHGVSGSSARIVQVRGDSMDPTLPDKSHVMVDIRDTDLPAKRELFAFALGAENFVRRLELRAPDTMLAISDNPDRPTEIHDPRGDLVRIIGRVVWAGQWVSRHP